MPDKTAIHEVHEYMIQAEVIGFSPGDSPSSRCQNQIYIPSRLPRFLRKEGYSSGHLRFFLLAPSWRHALHVSIEGILRYASELLTFCEGSSVYFERIVIRDDSYSFRCKWWRRIGPPSTGQRRVKQDMALDFFEKCMDKLTSPTYPRTNRIIESMYWLNETVVSASINTETRFTLAWLALETIVRSDDLQMESQTLLSRDEFQSLANTVRHWTRKNCSKDIRNEINNRLICINAPNSLQIFSIFCKKYDISLDVDLIWRIRDARNIIQHEPWRNIPGLDSLCFELESLVEKCICRVMDINPQEYLESKQKPWNL